MKIYTISDKYIDYLRNFDNKVPFNKNSTRPYVGIVFNINGTNFFAPLSSPKDKHLKMKNNLDIFKINNGKWGIINFNNMIPVPSEELKEIDFSIQKPDYKSLLTNQQRFFSNNKTVIQDKGLKLYTLYTKGQLNTQIISRCCDFPLLEKEAQRWHTLTLKAQQTWAFTGTETKKTLHDGFSIFHDERQDTWYLLKDGLPKKDGKEMLIGDKITKTELVTAYGNNFISTFESKAGALDYWKKESESYKALRSDNPSLNTNTLHTQTLIDSFLSQEFQLPFSSTTKQDIDLHPEHERE